MRGRQVLDRVVGSADGGPEPMSLEELEPLLSFLESPQAAPHPRAASLIQVARPKSPKRFPEMALCV